MNFFCVGFFILAFQLNLSWAVNYALKLVGMLFVVGGVWEMSCYNKRFERLMKPAVANACLSLVCAVTFAMLSFFGISETLRNVLGVAVGAVVTMLAIIVQKNVLDTMSADSEIVNDLAGLERLKSAWKTVVYFSLAGLFFNALNLVPVDTISDTAALIMAICRVIMYIIALVMLWRFNKVRTDHNNKYR